MNRRGTRGAAAPHVIMIGSEGLPFSKTGGLADVLGSLPPAIARRGWDVTVVLPRYRGVTAGAPAERFPLAIGARALLVEGGDLFDREALYSIDNVDYPDNPLRFAFLVRAALEYAARL